MRYRFWREVRREVFWSQANIGRGQRVWQADAVDADGRLSKRRDCCRHTSCPLAPKLACSYRLRGESTSALHTIRHCDSLLTLFKQRHSWATLHVSACGVSNKGPSPHLRQAYNSDTPHRPVLTFTMATQDAKAKELALVGKVEMRIALASSEKKLEDLLKIYLSPLLLKLGSEHAAVRNKVCDKHACNVYEAFQKATNLDLYHRSSPFVNTSTPASSHSTHSEI